jgi:hypothetical protein
MLYTSFQAGLLQGPQMHPGMRHPAHLVNLLLQALLVSREASELQLQVCLIGRCCRQPGTHLLVLLGQVSKGLLLAVCLRPRCLHGNEWVTCCG